MSFRALSVLVVLLLSAASAQTPDRHPAADDQSMLGALTVSFQVEATPALEIPDVTFHRNVLFAFKEVTYAQGQHTSDITLEEVKTYDVLPAEHFDPDPSAASS